MHERLTPYFCQCCGRLRQPFFVFGTYQNYEAANLPLQALLLRKVPTEYGSFFARNLISPPYLTFCRRWCETYPEYFAISTLSVSKGAVIHVQQLQLHPRTTNCFSAIAPRPDFVRDFDFLSTPGIPRLAAAVGHELFVCPIGTDS